MTKVQVAQAKLKGRPLQGTAVGEPNNAEGAVADDVAVGAASSNNVAVGGEAKPKELTRNQIESKLSYTRYI